ERKLATARMEKLKADTRISNARAKALEDNGQDIATALDKVMDKLIDESNKESGNKC
ncbi:terminase small subunit, partial [Lactiplantibacillus plantarum]